KSANGKQLLEYLIQPILNSYLYWKPEQTTFAILKVLIKTSLFKGKTYTLKHGLRQIPVALAQKATIEYEANVTSIKEVAPSGYRIAYTKNAKQYELAADGVVCATTASVVPRIVDDLSSEHNN